MKKIFFILIIIGGCFVVNSVLATPGSFFDGRLKILLGGETDPFFPDSIRHNFLETGMQRCARLSNQMANFKIARYIKPNETTVPTFTLYSLFTITTPIADIQAIWFKDAIYALREINVKNIAQSKIRTSEKARYWFRLGNSYFFSLFGVYPATTESTAIWIFGSAIPLWSDTAKINPGFENEVVLYALYLCKLRQGEIEIANFIKQIAINEILDLKAILENRPVDVTITKEVISR